MRLLGMSELLRNSLACSWLKGRQLPHGGSEVYRTVPKCGAQGRNRARRTNWLGREATVRVTVAATCFKATLTTWMRVVIIEPEPLYAKSAFTRRTTDPPLE
jgi:hypothetical protein